MNFLQMLPFLQSQNAGGGINMNIPAGMGLRMPNLPSAAADAVGLRAPAGALGLSQATGGNPQQIANLAMGLLGSANQQPEQMPEQAPVVMPEMPSMRSMMGQQAPSLMQQFAPQAMLMSRQANDEMMRQRMQGLMALLGGQ